MNAGTAPMRPVNGIRTASSASEGDGLHHTPVTPRDYRFGRGALGGKDARAVYRSRCSPRAIELPASGARAPGREIGSEDLGATGCPARRACGDRSNWRGPRAARRGRDVLQKVRGHRREILRSSSAPAFMRRIAASSMALPDASALPRSWQALREIRAMEQHRVVARKNTAGRRRARSRSTCRFWHRSNKCRSHPPGARRWLLQGRP